MTKATLVATVIAPPTADGKELTALASSVEWLEVRADLVGDLSPAWLRAHFSGKLLYSLRSKAEGGRFDGSAGERQARLRQAALDYDVVDLEGERDLLADILTEIAPHQRLISWHGAASDCATLEQRLEKMSGVAAKIYKLVPRAAQAGDELAALSLLKLAGRADTIAYTTGKTSFWSRLVAPYFGLPMVFGTIGRQPGVAEEPTISQLMEDYDLPNLRPLREIYGIVGDPVYHSLSPRLHNAAYRALSYPALFVPFHAESFNDFWRDVVEPGKLDSLGIAIKGFTIASPHKEEALKAAEASSPMVQRAGSTNIFVRHNGTWRADTTDPQGVVEALGQRGIDVAGKKVAVVGCGGSGRAIAAALDQAGAAVTLVNRGLERAHYAIERLGLPFVPLSEFSVGGFSVIVNATPVGRHNNDLPFKLAGLGEDAIIVDLVYGGDPTSLIASALALGRVAIDGREVLFVQVRLQFHLMTGREMPVELAANILGPGVQQADSVFAA
jgi:3-dehydroquinate dehydratase / shikimate dehydrogenase